MATATAPKKVQSTTRPTKKAAKAPETDDELIARALSHHGWPRWEVNGIADEELFQEICLRLSQALVCGPRQYAVNHRSGAIWFDQSHTVGVPSISGDELVAAARRIYRLPQPQQLVEHSRNGKVRHTMEPKGKAVKSQAVTPAAGPVQITILETVEIPLGKIARSPFQTRSEPDKAWLQEIAESMKQHGQTTPALGRWSDDRFELIAGHTRHQAAESLDWITLRCEVCDVDDPTAARLVYLENAKRRELTAIDRANGLKLLADQYALAGKTQAQCAADAEISEGQMSNMLRLLRLPDVWQQRLIGGELSVEQSRALATWVDYPKVIEAFETHIQNCGLKEGPIDKHHFERALEVALERASRPMSKDHYGRGCLFKPTDAERAELDIREVKQSYGPPAKRAFNLTLWNKLQKAAVKKKKDNEAKQQTATEGAKSSGKQSARPRDDHRFKQEIQDAWILAYRAAIAKHLEAKKLPAADRTAIARLAFCLPEPVETKPSELFTMPQADLDELCVAAVRSDLTRVLRGNWDTGGIDFEPLQSLVHVLRLNAAPHFIITEDTFEGFGDSDLVKLAGQMDLELVADRFGRIEQIVSATWPRDDVPELLLPPVPKKAKAKK